MRVLRPGGAALLEQRPEDALVAGDRARVRRGRGARPPRDVPALSTRRARPRARSARAPRTSARRRRRPRGTARPTARRRARRPRRGSRRRRAPPGCRTRRPCAGRSPRRDASALTATLPLCEITATGPGSHGAERVAPQRDAVGQRDDPVAVRPAHRHLPRRRHEPRLQVAVVRLREPGREHDRAAAAQRARARRRRRARRPRASRRRPPPAPPAARRARDTRARRAPTSRRGFTAYTAPAVAEPREVEQHLAAVRPRPLGRADHRHRRRRDRGQTP